MNNEIRVENWNGYDIRFVDHNGEWWAVLADVCKPLGLKPKYIKERLDDRVVLTDLLNDRFGRPHNTLLVNENGLDFSVSDAIYNRTQKGGLQ